MGQINLDYYHEESLDYDEVHFVDSDVGFWRITFGQQIPTTDKSSRLIYIKVARIDYEKFPYENGFKNKINETNQ